MTMTHEEQADKMAEVWEEISFLREQGQQEYARDEDNAHSNFEWVADMLNRGREHKITREDVLLVYALKHLDGITSYINGHKGQREDVRGRINDLIVYMILLRGMIDDKE